ncbi:MAG: glycosyltransferase family 4 protein [Weeksellaceae bacterium]|nr:glycosyltransferase family 4 protein [Weeksellaceae bacterium]
MPKTPAHIKQSSQHITKVIRLTTHLDFGGTEKTMISFTEQPQLLTHRYIFVALGRGGYTEKILKKRGFEVHILGQNPSVYNYKCTKSLYQLLKKIQPDVIHCQVSEANFHGLLVAKLLNIPIRIGEEVGFPSHSSKGRWMFRQLYNTAHKVICVSDSVKNHLVEIKEISPAKAMVLANPVTRPHPVDKVNTDYFHWVYVGRLSNIKNLNTVFNSFAQLPKDVRGKISLVGSGDQEPSLRAQAEELGIEDEIIFHGFSQQPEDIVATADVLLLPSFSEGFGIAAVEAMLQGVPCLATNRGGIPEFIEHGVNGWLINPFKPAEITQAMQDILNLPKPQFEEIANNAYLSTKDKFTVEDYVKSLESVYAGL